MSFSDLLSKLPFINKDTERSEVYFALLVGFEKVSAALWLVEKKRLRILNTAQSSLEGDDQKELLQAANKVLDECLADLPFDPEKVLFGVPETWLADDNLKPDYLKKLRVLTKELGLTPMAFVSSSHAVSHFLQVQTGAPVSAILINNSDPLVVTVVKAGKIMASREVKRGDNLNEDIEKALLGIEEVEVLPSRLIVFGEKKMEGVKERMSSFPWMSKLPFLHLPKIDVLDKSVPLSSVCFAGAFEIEPEVSFVPEVVKKEVGGVVSKLEMENEEDVEDRFVAGDIGESRDIAGRDIARRDDVAFGVGGGGGLAKVGLWEKVSKILRLDKLGGGNRNWIIIAGLAAAFLVGTVLAYLLLLKVEVSMFIDAKTLEKEAVVVADPKTTTADEANKRIPGKIVSASLSDSATGKATGTKQVGDPARGKVVVYNKTDAAKSLAAGTTFTSDGGVKYKLKTAVSIASQSAKPGPDQSTIITPGKTEPVEVEAVNVGPEGNLAGNSNLSVAGFTSPQVLATVDVSSPISGGTSKEVTVVTADDQKRLLAQLSSDMRKKARDQIQGKLSGDMKVLEEGLQETITKQTYSKKVGDQAGEFSLTMSADYKGTAYSDSDLKTMVGRSVETTIPEGYSLNLEESETQTAASKIDKDGVLVFDVKFKAKLMPKLDSESLKKSIRGKTPDEATVELKKVENVIGAVYAFSPSLPTFLQRVPLTTGNITLDIVVK